MGNDRYAHGRGFEIRYQDVGVYAAGKRVDFQAREVHHAVSLDLIKVSAWHCWLAAIGLIETFLSSLAKRILIWLRVEE